jgi:monofunctional glycosyltransferase
MKTPGWLSFAGRWLLWVLLVAVGLQLFFAGRIALMAHVNPESTAFMRSEAWRRVSEPAGEPQRPWAQQWVNADRISAHLKRAVVAAEDDGFAQHAGVDWAAIESARTRNQKRETQAPPSHSNWPKTCCSRVNATWPAKGKSCC